MKLTIDKRTLRKIIREELSRFLVAEKEEDLNEGDPDSAASRALMGGIRKAQNKDKDKEKKEEEDKKKEKEEEERKANSPASRDLMGGIRKAQAEKPKTKYKGSTYSKEE